MGCPQSTEARGGGGMAGGGRWRRGEGERRPAVGTKGGDGTRVVLGEREGEHEDRRITWNTSRWSATAEGGRNVLATRAGGGGGGSSSAAT